MKLTQLEQSGIIIETDSGFKLAIDIASMTPVDTLDGVTPDAMIVSHIHGDHFSVPHIQALAPDKLYLNEECIEALGEQVVPSGVVETKVGDTLDIEGITVQFFDVDHGPNATMRPRENFGLLLTVDGKKIYFAGDMFYPSGIDVADLEVDVVLVPVGGFYTFGPEEALDFVKSFKHIGTVRPMHYQIAPENRDEFVKLASAAGFQVE